MQIWIADFSFELTSGLRKVVPDVVITRIPNSHIHRRQDIIDRATRGFSITELKTLQRDKKGAFKYTIKYIKKVGVTNG